ncbi:hypothetical protein Tco_0356229 [Tanacetum coccineum]
MKATMAWRCRACDDLLKDYLCVPLTPIVNSAAQSKNGGVTNYAPHNSLRSNPTSLSHRFSYKRLFEILSRFLRHSFPLSIASISRQLCGHETTHALVKKKGKAKDEYYGKLILDLGNKVLSRMEEGTTAIENLVRKLGNAEERVECKKLKKELEEERIMHPKSSPLTQSAVRQMIKESVDAAIATEQARDANARNNASRSGQARGAVELRRWFEKMEMTFGIRECAEDKKVKFNAATLRGPTLT